MNGIVGRRRPKPGFIKSFVRGHMVYKMSRSLRKPGEGVGISGRSAIELVAGRMVETVAQMTSGRLGHWRMLADVADQLKVGEAVADKAAAFAVEKGWMEEAVHSVRLTNAGRQRRT